jgi:hypothetical protein
VTHAEGAVARQCLIRELSGMDRMHTHLHVLEVGTLSLVGLPGEPFTHIVLEIKARSGRPHTVVVSYCGDEAGHFPDRRAFAEGKCKTFITPYRDDVGDLLADRAVRLLQGA